MTPPKYARIDFPTIRIVALRNAIAVCSRILPGGRVKLVEAFKCATPNDRIAFARVIGPTELFETAIEPAL
jgi:hypothetical protein